MITAQLNQLLLEYLQRGPKSKQQQEAFDHLPKLYEVAINLPENQ